MEKLSFSKFEGIRRNEKEREGRGDPSPKEEVKFHYNREERLKKQRQQWGSESSRQFLKKRRKKIFIILIDLILVSAAIYFLNRPANLFIDKKVEDVAYELNVAGIRGKKVLISFTIKNPKQKEIVFSRPVNIWLKIIDKSGRVLMQEKKIEENTILLPNESNAVIFLFNKDELPRFARLELYYETQSSPLFTRNVRF